MMNEEEEWDEDDEFENAMDRCGYFPDAKTCLLAGSEECEFHCPLRALWEKGLPP